MQRSIHQNQQTAFTVIDGEVALIHIHDSRLYWLNPVASRIWTLSDGQNSAEAIATALCQEFDVEYDRALRDVEQMVSAFVAKQLIYEEEIAHA